MLLCPKCKIEYQDGYKTCSDCGSSLIEQPEVKEKVINKNNELKLGAVSLSRKLSLLFGIFGGLFLVFLRLPQVNLYLALRGFQGYVTDCITSIISLIGLIFVVYFSILLIIDTIKTIKE